MRKMDSCYLVVEDVLVDVCLHCMIKDYRICFREFVIFFFFQIAGGLEAHEQVLKRFDDQIQSKEEAYECER